MAPFNQRQIGYIQAIAGRQQHRTLICDSIDMKLDSGADVTSDNRKPKTINPNYVLSGYSTGTHADAKSLLLHHFNLDGLELGFDSRAVHNNERLEAADYTGVNEVLLGCGNMTDLNVFNAPVKGYHALTALDSEQADKIAVPPSAEGELVRNPELVSSIHRATPDGFLNSTDLKFRFTLPRIIDAATSAAGNPMGQDHYEFRWIVWRNKRPTLSANADDAGNHATNLEAIRDGCSMRNCSYDFFMGQTGRKRGLLGYTLNEKLDSEKIQGAPNGEVYSGYRWETDAFTKTGTFSDAEFDGVKPRDGIPNKEKEFTVDDLLTMRINRDDYVVLKDVRFFLGKEHGKSHFEDTLHWDWNDPIDTPSDNVLSSPTLNSKNYRWHMTLIGTSGGKSPCQLHSSIRWTTKMESG